MVAYDAEPWSDLFVAAAGASAALAGLVFVAVSINVERIIALPGLPERALQALIQLLGAVLVSIAVLVPGQSAAALGVELLAIGLVLALASYLLLRKALREHERGGNLARGVLVALGTAPFAIAGVSLLAEMGGGIYWVAAGVALALVGAVLNAWVLLVEILR